MTAESRREELYSLLGDLPPRDRPISATQVSARQVLTNEDEGYFLETWMLDLNGIEPVPAYFTRPLSPIGAAPVILYNHAHGGDYVLGKEEYLRGRSAILDPPYAALLSAMGYCGLCIDTWNFGERRGRTESELFKEMLWRGQVLWGMMVYDNLRAIDYLLTRPEVDPGRVATVGLSMGSTMAWWTAALDTRVRVCVDLCCLTDFETLIETRGLDGHGIYYYVPGLLKHFTTAQINALIAPRAHLSLAGNYDRLTPPAGLDRIDEELREVYAEAGAPEAWTLLRWDIGHFETHAMRAEIVAFLKRWL
jgi:hypothetical protein